MARATERLTLGVRIDFDFQNPMFARAAAILSLVAILAPPLASAGPSGTIDPDRQADVRRLLSVLSGIRDEYGEAHDAAGRVVRPVEIEEAKLLVADGHDVIGRVGDLLPADAGATLDRVAAALASGGSVDAVAKAVDDLRARISAATGVLDAAPERAPSVARGATLFAENCTGCHGKTGRGDGPEAATLHVKPANFSDPTFMREETSQDFFNVISLGRRKSGMPEWDEGLGVQERWDLVAYLWTLTGTPPSAGVDAYRAACASCHGATLEGGSGVPSLADPLALARVSENDIVRLLGEGVHRDAPAVAALSEETRQRVATWIARTSLSSPPAHPGAPEEAAMSLRGLDEATRLLEESLAAAPGDVARASALATQAYVAFEPYERGLRVRRPDLVDGVEQSFVAYRLALRAGTEPAQLADLAAAAKRALDEAAAVLRGPGTLGWGTAFGQAITIVVREGVEIILIVGALLTWVRRQGNLELVRVIHLGVVAGVLASVATAALLMTGLRHLPWASEAIEGGAMLVAALVLFWVSYWLVSKAEADRWQRFIRDRVETAIGSGSRMALAGAAFLAVYREGFESVLFFQALVAGGGGAGPVAAGFVAGCAVLGALYVAMRWFGMQIPIRPFFLVTGALLYGLSIVFAGRGVAELQEAGAIAMTPVGLVPTIPALGLYPTVETLVAQGVLVALLLVAVVITVRRRPRDVAATVAVLAALLLAPAGVARADGLGAPPVAEAREWLMGTVGEVRVYAMDRPDQAPAAIEAAFAEMRTIDRLMAVQRPESDVSRMNREAATRATSVDPRVIDVLCAARRVSQLTDGAFDVTVLPVVEAWGFLEGPPHRPRTRPPGPAGWGRVDVDVVHGTVRYETPEVGVDLGGIAKGYALDRARDVLLGRGAHAAWLDLGGNVATIGTPPGASAWRIGVRDPRHAGALLGVVEVGEASVSTSSDAERFVDDADGRAGHVIDPRTGAPADALVAATVVTASGTLADALSTAAVVLGARRFEPVLARVAGEALLARARDGGGLDLTATPGLVFTPAAEP
jgi:high-affinity iron transporter